MNREIQAGGSLYRYQDDGTYQIPSEAEPTRIANFTLSINNGGWIAETFDIEINLTKDGQTFTCYVPYSPDGLVTDDEFPFFDWLVEPLDLGLRLDCSRNELRRIVMAEYESGDKR